MSSDTKVVGFETADMSLSLRGIGGQPIDVTVFGKNVFNEYYYGGTQLGSKTLSVFSAIVAPPRTYGISVRYTFD